MFKQPLVHFLLLGILLFVLFEWKEPDQNANARLRTIHIDRDGLLTFMQYRSKAFNEEHFARQLDTMSDADRQRLINELVREEVLYREAQTLQLDKNDYVIKRRLIQKLEFLTRGFITAGPGLTNEDIQSYYEEHRHEYFVQPHITFTHVFYDYEHQGRNESAILAQGTLEQLNREKISFSEGIQYGDRFLYHTNYVERTPDYIASHFGINMAESVFELPANDQQWHGPFESPYGLHLIMLTNREPGRFPELDEIYNRIKDDAEEEIVRQRTEEAIAEIIGSYEIDVVLE